MIPHPDEQARELRKYAHELAEAVMLKWFSRPLDEHDPHVGLMWVLAAIEKFGDRVRLAEAEWWRSDRDRDLYVAALEKELAELRAAAPSLHKEPLLEKLDAEFVKGSKHGQEAYRRGDLYQNKYWQGFNDAIQFAISEAKKPAALHKEGAPECRCANNPLNSWPNLPHDKDCPLASPLPLQRTIPDEQFKGAVVEPIEQAVDNEISITIQGQVQVAIVMEALHKAGFVGGQCASPVGRAYSPKGNFCSICRVHDEWCEHIQPPAGRAEQEPK